MSRKGWLDEALHIYRSHFRPSAVLDTPHAIAAFNIIAAETDAEAEYLASSLMQSFDVFSVIFTTAI